MTDHNDDLDDLLDSALDDFNNLNLTSSSSSQSVEGKNEEQNLEREKSAVPIQGLGMGLGLPDLKSKNKKGKQKKKEGNDHASEALDKLMQQTREAVRGLENTAKTGVGVGLSEELGKDGMLDDWVKQFEDLAGTQDMESMVETMMQQLLSKEILHEPMREIGERYPKWLEEHKSELSNEDYSRYSNQYALIKELNTVYDNEPNNFTKIVDLMQKMQECGQPPSDIVNELAPDLDLANLGQLSPELLDSQTNCSIM